MYVCLEEHNLKGCADFNEIKMGKRADIYILVVFQITVMGNELLLLLCGL